MSLYDDLTPNEQASADYIAQLLTDRRREIPTTEHLRICERIEPDTRQWDGVVQIADRFKSLTMPLPLAGAAALKPLANGELAITAYLRAEAPWMAAAIDLLDEQFRAGLWAGRPWIEFRPLLLVGGPGTGKSHLARLIAEVAGTGHAVLSMAGLWESSLLIGAPRSYTSPGPCFPAAVMAQTETANPILVGDELDKVATDRRMGDPHAALLTLIEPGTAARFYDKRLLSECDVSHANWLFTANTVDGLSAPLRSRLDIVTLDGPSEEHFDVLLRNLTRDVAKRWHVPSSSLPDLASEAEALLRRRFARSRSVRQLQREVQAALAAGLKMTRPTLN